MSNGEIVDTLARDGTIKSILTNLKVEDEYFDDLFQEVALALLQYNNEKLDKMMSSGEIRFFITRIVLNLHHSKTSTFYFKFKKFNKITETLSYE